MKRCYRIMLENLELKKECIMNVSIEMYKTDECYGCWISDLIGGSGISVEEATKEELIKEVSLYLEDYLYRLDGDIDND